MKIHKHLQTLPKKKVALSKKTYTQKFRTELLSDSAFKAWLVAPRPGSSDASSKFCQKTVSWSKTSHADLEWRQQALETCMSTESDSDSDWRLLRNTLKGCQTFQNSTEKRNLFPITILGRKSTLYYTITLLCGMNSLF